MATNTFLNIDIPEAEELADLAGISHDFRSVIHFAGQLKEMLERNPPDYSLVEPMTIAILVRYSRPFAKGVRLRLKEHELETLSPTQRAAHDRFLLWRNKHIAHSVNAFEENQPVARYWVERFNDEGFSSIECNACNLVGISLHDIEMVIALSRHFIEKLKPRLEVEKEKVLQIVRSLPREQVLARAKTAREPQMKDVGKVRRT